MGKAYKQLTLRERKEIEEGLGRGDSFRAIARLIGRSPSTVSREVRENRHVRAFKSRKSACRDRNWCKRVGVCAECVREGAFCAGCNRANRFVHDAQVAQKASDGRRSDSRRGIDMAPERAEAALARIKDGLSRRLSPYEISVWIGYNR